MTLLQTIGFVILALVIAWSEVLPWAWRREARNWLLLIASVAAIYWLQPLLPIRNLDFWLPTSSVGLVLTTWAVSTWVETPTGKIPPIIRILKTANLRTGLVIFGLVLGVGSLRYLGPLCCLTPSRPPDLLQILIAWVLIGLMTTALLVLQNQYRVLISLMILAILGGLIILKTPALAMDSSIWLRSLTGQSAALASDLDIRWLGFSYLAFRLIHTLRDHVTGKLPAYSLREFSSYALFFPAIAAGPIDRIQRFMSDYRHNDSANATITQPERAALSSQTIAGLWRILKGVFKKFVLADALALIALNGQNASDVRPGFWMWVVVYAYALRIYFDFSGYTDVAIGLGNILGFKLPENFERPYLKTNLTTFWNSWHITLAQWFRAYFFNPLTRSLRMRQNLFPAWSIILLAQVSTMLLIGLWHGVTWNFALWGAWHGIGLFAHNRWSDWLKPHATLIDQHPRWQPLLRFGGWFLTFHYVVLGWVWFALPDFATSWQVFQKLMRIG